MPLSFEVNRGQTDPQVKFLSRGDGYVLFLTSAEAVLAVSKDQEAGVMTRSASPSRAFQLTPSSHARNSHQTELRIKLVGANPAAPASGMAELPGKSNYFLGRDPKGWHTNVPNYARVEYRSVYPGIDIIYSGNGRQLEYDFIIAPGADPRAITLDFAGADKIEIDRQGDLLLRVGRDVILQRRPHVYQEVGGVRRTVAGEYALKGNRQVAFRVGAYDATKPLVIDPVLVIYSTLLAGSGPDEGMSVAVDSAGSAYVTGATSSLDFPGTPGALQTARGGNDVFVAKLNAAGSGLVYSSYFGGSGDDTGFGVAVGFAGSAYVTGATNSSDFPTTARAHQNALSGSSDAFVAILNAAGSRLLYSTYFGGGNHEESYGIAVDRSRNVYVTGVTASTNFPTTAGAFQTALGGPLDAFVTKLNPAAYVSLIYSTYLGGAGPDIGFGVAADKAGDAYVTGTTESPNFPATTGASQTIYGGAGDAFVTKLNASGTAQLFSTFAGGGSLDIGFGIAADSAGSAYVTGATGSADFPVTAGGTSPIKSEGDDAFVIKLNAAGSSADYSRFIGGDKNDVGLSVAVDAAGNAYITGSTDSSDFPTVGGASQTAPGGGTDTFVSELNPSGTELLYSTYLGGSGDDSGFGVAVDLAGSAYVTGATSSSNFPATTGAFQTGAGGGRDGFVAKLAISGSGSPGFFHFSNATYGVGEGDGKATITVTRSGDTSVAAKVGYATQPDAAYIKCNVVNGAASERCDYSTTVGVLRFQPGETSKTFVVPVSDDSFTEGSETVNLTLASRDGSTSSVVSTATLTISDNDPSATPNPFLRNDFFVRQHYLDFLSREPDAGGYAYWQNLLNTCGMNQGGLGSPPDCDRVHVSSRFYLSTEFGERGYWVYRFYEASVGRLPKYVEFIPDMASVSGSQTTAENEASKADFISDLMARPEFATRYEGLTTTAQAAAFVAKLEQTAGIVMDDSARMQMIAQMQSGQRTAGETLRAFVESQAVWDKFFFRGFVAMQYFGHLRRDPEPADYDDWVDVLTNGRGDIQPEDYHHLISGFIYAVEYRERFGPP